jgi:hypothetical protein
MPMNERMRPLWGRVAGGLLLLALVAGPSAQEPGVPEPTPAPDAHARRLAELDAIARDGDQESPFLGVRVLRELRERYEKRKAVAPPMERWLILRKLCVEELKHGNEAEAIAAGEAAAALVDGLAFDKLERRVLPGEEAQVKDLATYYHNVTWFELGIAYLRFGETQNCCLRHTGESCIMPLQGAALHTAREGSEGAIRCFTKILERRPAEPDPIELKNCEAQARWLLNVAYMTLGEHPQGVPERWRVDVETLFHSEVEFPRFENVLPELGLDTFDLSGGVIVDDFDGDDQLDILLSSWDTRGPMHFFRNEKDGTFGDHTQAANLTGLVGGLNMWQGDYDNDGDLDVVVPRGAWMAEWGKHPTSLLRNDGKGRFADVALEAGLERARFPGKTGGFADYDLDGDLDLYLGYDYNVGYEDAYPQLYRNDGDGTFTERAAEAGLRDPLYVMGVSWGDYDEDRYPDLMVAALNNKASPALSRLYHNERDGTFRDATKAAGLVPNPAPFPCWFFDFDNDGHLDIYLSCRSGTVAVLADASVRACSDALYKGDGRGHFVDVAAAVGMTHPALPMGSNFGDLNGDGFLDVYLGTGNADYSELHPNVMYLNLGGKRFTNVTMKGGFGHLQKGHGVSFADLDSDGDQDVYIQMGGAFAGDKFSDALFENPGFGNHWIALELEGVRENRSAIGARLRLDVDEGGVRRSIFRHVTSGGSYGSSPLRQNVGLGRAAVVARLEVFWPVANATQVFENVPVDRAYRIVEGRDELVPLVLARTVLGSAARTAAETKGE